MGSSSGGDDEDIFLAGLNGGEERELGIVCSGIVAILLAHSLVASFVCLVELWCR